MSFPLAPVDWSDPKEALRKIAETVNLSMRGKTNNVGTCTLAASTVSTSVVARLMTPRSRVFLQPTGSATPTDVKVTTKGDGYFVLTHDSDAATDRIYDFLIVG